MKRLILITIFFTTFSCIPTRIAPQIKEDKLMIAKRLKRKLPKRYALVFQDPKDANEFYNYINTKFELQHQNVEHNVPFTLGNETFYFSFRETEVATKSINLVPIAVDKALESKGYSPILKDAEFTRVGNWYLVLTASNSESEDCLHPDHPSQAKVLQYLRSLRVEYLSTSNYLELLFKK